MNAEILLQGYQFSEISGNLEMSENSAKVWEKAKQGICVIREI